MRVAAATLLGVLAAAGCGGAAAPQRPPRSFVAVAAPGPTATAQRVGAAAPAAVPRGRWLTARLRRPALMRARPAGRVVGRLGTRTEFGSPKVVGVLRRRGGWLQVVAPERPNGRAAWIPAADARLGATDVSIRVDRSARTLTLLRGDRVLRRFAVAVGRPGTPTPLGRFAVTDLLRAGRPDSPYGCCALALSGHQPRLVPGWPGGDRLAIHATPQVETIGRRASLGCLRASTRDVRALMRRVPLGAPVFVRR